MKLVPEDSSYNGSLVYTTGTLIVVQNLAFDIEPETYTVIVSTTGTDKYQPGLFTLKVTLGG